MSALWFGSPVENRPADSSSLILSIENWHANKISFSLSTSISFSLPGSVVYKMAEQSTCARVEPADDYIINKCLIYKFGLVFIILVGLETTFDISWYSFLVLCIIPQPDVKEQLGKGAGIGQVSKVVGNMWKKLPTDRRKVSYKLLTLRMFVY